MTYGSPQALRMALERRLHARSSATGVSLDRLRRRVVFQLRQAVRGVWAERDRSAPPERFAAPPANWASPFERMAAEADLQHARLGDAAELASELWTASMNNNGGT